MRIDVILPPGADAATVERVALLAEEFGLQGLWTASFPAHRDPFMTLVPAARSTGRLRLGVLPMSPFEKHPVKIADSLLTLHDLSRGRAALLLGGLGKSGMYALGIAPTRRVTAVADSVRILKGAASGQPFQYDGEVFRAGRYHAPWSPSPRPVLYVAANGPQMLRMAGREADGVMLSDATEPLMPDILENLARGLSDRGRSLAPAAGAAATASANPDADGAGFRVSNFWAWHIKRDRAAAFREARRELVWRGALLRSHIEHCLGPDDVTFVERHWDSFYRAFVTGSDVIAGVPDRIVDALITGLTFAGDARDVPLAADRLRKLEAAGQNEIALRLFDEPEAGVRAIGELLLPELARRSG